MEKPVRYHVEQRIGYITLCRPEKHNALSPQMIEGISEALEQAHRDEQAKVVVLRAEGKHFCAGADLQWLHQMQGNSFEANLADSQTLRRMFEKLYSMPKVVIAQVQGHAIAGGTGLISVCDFVFSVPEAKFGYTEVKIGFIPALVLVFLSRRMSEGRARRLVLTGDLVMAAQAQELGLITEVVAADRLEEHVRAFADKLCVENSGQSMGIVKRMFAETVGMGLDDALDYAAQMNARARSSADCIRGIQAFLNKEKIVW